MQPTEVQVSDAQKNIRDLPILMQIFEEHVTHPEDSDDRKLRILEVYVMDSILNIAI